VVQGGSPSWAPPILYLLPITRKRLLGTSDLRSKVMLVNFWI